MAGLLPENPVIFFGLAGLTLLHINVFTSKLPVTLFTRTSPPDADTAPTWTYISRAFKRGSMETLSPDPVF